MRADSKRFQSPVDRVTNELRSAALRMDEGDFLGSEEFLSQRFQVSAPTLRQAVRRLEHEEVLIVKRGIGGGYFVTRPKLDTISRIAAIFVRGNPGSIDEFYEMVKVLAPFAVNQIVQNPELSELKPFSDMEKCANNTDDYVAQELRFSEILRKLAKNTPLLIIFSIFEEIGLSIRDEVSSTTHINRTVQMLRVDLARALIGKNMDLAVEAFSKYFGIIVSECKAGLDFAKTLQI